MESAFAPPLIAGGGTAAVAVAVGIPIDGLGDGGVLVLIACAVGVAVGIPIDGLGDGGVLVLIACAVGVAVGIPIDGLGVGGVLVPMACAVGVAVGSCATEGAAVTRAVKQRRLMLKTNKRRLAITRFLHGRAPIASTIPTLRGLKKRSPGLCPRSPSK
ncbi:MAG: hypothetical protein L6Q80_12020 [Dehalococcoidia bacterium]|nr:hypothetical protein [Dehalococcoidia bacterium]MCK6565455.1 hypothetical protein [Dehalococcoidia bacterium]